MSRTREAAQVLAIAMSAISESGMVLRPISESKPYVPNEHDAERKRKAEEKRKRRQEKRREVNPLNTSEEPVKFGGEI